MITNITLFSTALCNLRCNYCYINKCQNLNDIDNQVQQNLKNSFNQIIHYEPNIKYNLKTITIWGGEPVLHLERIIEILPQYINYFPNLKNFFISTNFTLDNEIEQLKRFINFLQQYKRVFNINLQLSIDGYKEMNDSQRGIGSTDKFIENFKHLSSIEYNPDYIRLYVFNKPTLSAENLDYLLDIEQCEEWYNFFDSLYRINKLWKYRNSPWNFAEPYQYSKQDGEKYYQICNNLLQLNKIIPEVLLLDKKSLCRDCGVIPHNLTPIGQGLFIPCHKGWFDDLNHQTILTQEQLKELQLNILFARENYEQQLENNLISLIINNDNVNKKYKNKDIILPTLILFKNKQYCPYNNHQVTGKWNKIPSNLIPLYYNGAIDLIMQQIESRN